MMFIGNIIAFSGVDIPDGYLVCNGAAVSRSYYDELFSVIGTTYGSGDGVSTFNIPNLSGKVGIGASNIYSLGSGGGENFHTLLSSETPAHTHEIPQHTHGNSISVSLPSLGHTITQPVFYYTGINSSNIVTNDLSNYYGFPSDTSAAMTRTADLTVADHPATACTVIGGIEDCPSMTTSNSGNGDAHNNMMPYMSITYLIKTGKPAPIIPQMLMYNGCYVATNGGGYITGKAN